MYLDGREYRYDLRIIKHKVYSIRQLSSEICMSESRIENIT